GRSGFPRVQIAAMRAMLALDQLGIAAAALGSAAKSSLSRKIESLAGPTALHHARVLPARLRHWLVGAPGRPKRLERRGGHDILFFGGEFYCIPHTLGTVNFASIGERSQPGIVRDRDLRRALARS